MHKAILYDLDIHNKMLEFLGKGDYSSALSLIRKEADLSIYVNDYVEQLFKHVDQNKIQVISDFLQELIKRGYNVNDAWTIAIKWNSLAVLIKNGANPNQIIEISNEKFVTPILIALGIDIRNDTTYTGVPQNDYESLKALLKAGANLNQVVTVRNSSDESWTPLLLAIAQCAQGNPYNNNNYYINFLLDAEADINQQAIPCPHAQNKNLRGPQTPLSFAINLGLKNVVEVLLEHGATL